MTHSLRDELELGLQLQASGSVSEAERIFSRAVALHPNSPESWHAMGVSRHQLGDFGGAADAISRAILFDSTQACFFNNYGAALQGLGRCPDAIASYYAAIHLNPKYLDANLNLIRALGQQLQWPTSYRHAQKALEMWPEEPELLKQGVLAAENAGAFDQAAQWAIQYVKLGKADRFPLNSDEAAVLLRKIGRWYLSQFRADEALCYLEEAAAIEPNSEETLLLIARVHSSRDEYRQVLATISRGRKAAGSTKQLWDLLEAVTCPSVFSSEAALDSFRSSLERRLDDLLAETAVIPKDWLFKISFAPPYSLGYHGALNRRIREKFAKLCQRSFSPQTIQPRRSDKPRIGFFVTLGREKFFLQCCGGILKRLSPELQLVIFCPRTGMEFIKRAIGRDDVTYIPIETHFSTTVKRVAETHCDLLYYWEVGSDALNYFVPFTRPARLQCLSWGTQGTSGNPQVDYFLSSEMVESASAAEHYTEKLWKLQTLPTWQERPSAPFAAKRDFFGFNSTDHLYLCPQNVMKLHPATDKLWQAIAQSDPQARLLFMHSSNAEPSSRLLERFKESIPDTIDRITFLPFQTRENFFRLLATADVILDSPGFTAGSSAYDIFAMNKPIVTLPGDTFQSRYVLGCYHKMGIQGLVATDSNDYVRQLVRLACDQDFRKTHEDQIGSCADQLFCDELAVSEHERFFRLATQ